MIYIILIIIIFLIIGLISSKNNVTKNNKTNSNKSNTEYKNYQVSETKDSITITYNNKAGYIDGKYYTEYVDDIKELKRQDKLKEAEELLLRIIEALKAEAKAEGPHWFLAPGYFEQLAIIYRKQKFIFKEKEILEKYLKLNKIKGDGMTPLEVRYRKVKEMIKKQEEIEKNASEK